MDWVQVTLDIAFANVTPLNNFLLDEYFQNLTIGLCYLFMLSMLAKYQDD